MTKDEALSNVKRLVRRWGSGHATTLEEVDASLDELTQATVDEFKANTLGLLEALAKWGNEDAIGFTSVRKTIGKDTWRGVLVEWDGRDPNNGRFLYYSSEWPDSKAARIDTPCNRAEVEALLAGKEKKE